MEPQSQDLVLGQPEDSNQRNTTVQDVDALLQLQRLAILYHSRGRVDQAREIFNLIMEIRNNQSTEKTSDQS